MKLQYVIIILLLLYFTYIDYYIDYLQFKEYAKNNQYKILYPRYRSKINNNHINNPFNIPLTIYQSWHSNNFPKNMTLNIQKLISMNPEFDYYLYSDIDCRLFIKNNFDEDVINAFDTLIPGAYKSDLWRYCILYINGGIYLDLKFYCKIPLKNILIYGSTLLCKDRFLEHMDIIDKDNVYNAFMISIPNNIIFIHCINDIVNSCKFKLYKNSPLSVTGPGLLGYIIMKYEPDKYNEYVKFIHEDGGIIKVINDDIIILGEYSEYRYDQKLYPKKKHYHKLWLTKNIYY
jgi:mannosyltransferase OCH1-like enzyme